MAITVDRPEYDVLGLSLRERRRREAALTTTGADLPGVGDLPGRRCSECASLIYGRPTAYTCSTDCADLRRKRVNRERAGAWRNRAKEAMADALQLFTDTGQPPPMIWLNLLASVPHGSRLQLVLPDGATISWFRP